MQVTLTSRQLKRSGRVGPLCLACGNKNRFWISLSSGPELMSLEDVVESDVRVVACGRCRSQHSLVMARVD